MLTNCYYLCSLQLYAKSRMTVAAIGHVYNSLLSWFLCCLFNTPLQKLGSGYAWQNTQYSCGRLMLYIMTDNCVVRCRCSLCHICYLSLDCDAILGPVFCSEWQLETESYSNSNLAQLWTQNLIKSSRVLSVTSAQLIMQYLVSALASWDYGSLYSSECKYINSRN